MNANVQEWIALAIVALCVLEVIRRLWRNIRASKRNQNICCGCSEGKRCNSKSNSKQATSPKKESSNNKKCCE